MVFGDPANDGNPVESGVYEAGENIPGLKLKTVIYCFCIAPETIRASHNKYAVSVWRYMLARF